MVYIRATELSIHQTIELTRDVLNSSDCQAEYQIKARNDHSNQINLISLFQHSNKRDSILTPVKYRHIYVRHSGGQCTRHRTSQNREKRDLTQK